MTMCDLKMNLKELKELEGHERWTIWRHENLTWKWNIWKDLKRMFGVIKIQK